MMIRKDAIQKNASLQALKQYSRFVEEKSDTPIHHNAGVLVSKWNYNKVFEIGIIIDANNAKVMICGDTEFCRDYSSEYTNQYQTFQYISPGMLLIKDAEDNWGNNVEIDISYKG